MEKKIKEPVIDDTFIVHKTIGHGYTSDVLLVTHKTSGLKLALKSYKQRTNQSITMDLFNKEIEAMKNLNHENLINIIAANDSGVVVHPDDTRNSLIYIAVEYAENMELFDYIAVPEKGFSEEMARVIFKQLILGLKSMHDHQIAHRDLKTENIFLDEKYRIKIGDFGFAKYIDTSQYDGKFRTRLGTVGYQSPQLIEGPIYSGEANDVFACGVILFIMVNAYPPFREGKRTDNWYKHIYNENFEGFFKAHSRKAVNMSPELKDLLMKMLRYNKRITASEILDHPWFKLPFASYDEYINEMASRKKKVDKKREEESDNKFDPYNSTTKVYRGVDKNEQYYILEKEMAEIYLKSLRLRKFEDMAEPKFSLLINTLELELAYKDILRVLAYENAKIVMSKEDYSLTAVVTYTTPEEEGSETVEVEFEVNFYLDYSRKAILVEFLKSRNSGMFDFQETFERVKRNI